MNTSLQNQPNLQQQANQLQPSQTVITQPQQPISRTETVIAPPLGQLDTIALVQYGGISSAIILSIAVLILSLAEFAKAIKNE